MALYKTAVSSPMLKENKLSSVGNYKQTNNRVVYEQNEILFQFSAQARMRLQ